MVMQHTVRRNDSMEIAHFGNVVAEGSAQRVRHPAAGLVKDAFGAAAIPKARATALDIDIRPCFSNETHLETDASGLDCLLYSQSLSNRFCIR